MFKGSRFCASCGAEARREVVGDEPELKCPRCTETMQALRLGGTAASECAECGGLWLDAASLQTLVNRREEYAGVVSTLAAHIPRSSAPPDTVRYVPCPRCGKLMNRQNFSRSSGVITDVCKTDGVWLDRGELQRLIGFVEAGGLTAQRQREREQLAEEQRRLASMQAMSTTSQRSLGEMHVSMTARYGSRTDDRIGLEGMLVDLAGLFTR